MRIASQPTLQLSTKPAPPIAPESDTGAASAPALSDCARGILSALQRDGGWISKSMLAHERECRDTTFFERALAFKQLLERRLIRICKRPIGGSMRSTTWYCANINPQLVPNNALEAEEETRKKELQILQAYAKNA